MIHKMVKFAPVVETRNEHLNLLAFNSVLKLLKWRYLTLAVVQDVSRFASSFKSRPLFLQKMHFVLSFQDGLTVVQGFKLLNRSMVKHE